MKILQNILVYISMLCVCFGLNLKSSDIYDQSWALIIGINDYDNVQDLNYAIDDALAIRNLLINDYGFKRKNVRYLIDGEATQNNIQRELNYIVKSAGKNDRVVFYFAGHGETEELGLDGGDMGFLIPVDGNLEDKYLTSIPMDELKRISKWSKAKHMLFLVDACYGGLAAMNTRGLSDSAPGYIDKIVEDPARQIITAGGSEEKVQEKDEWQHSAFTKNILSGLKETRADVNNDGVITGAELGMYVKEKVTIDTENMQTPQIRRFTSHEGEFVFIPNVVDEEPEKDEEDESLQKLVALLAQLESKQSATPTKTKDKIIVPGSRGFYLKNSQIFLVTDVFYTPAGLSYRGKLLLNIGASEDLSWSPVVSVPASDVLETEDSKIGFYNYSSGTIEE